MNAHILILKKSLLIMHITSFFTTLTRFWMPDRLCKVCYDCEQPFNMLRRRHHCRLCGQVFCHSCSPYFIDGKSLNVVGSIRACKMCNDQVENSAHSQPAPRKQQPDDRNKDEEVGGAPNSVLNKGGAPHVIHEEEEPRQRRVSIVSDNQALSSKQGVGLGLSVQEPGSSATLEHKSLVSLNDMNLTVDFDNDEEKERVETSSPSSSKGFTGPSLPGQGAGGEVEEEARRLSGKEGVTVAQAKAGLASKRGSNPILWAQQRIQKGMGKGAPVSAVLPAGSAYVPSSHFAGYREGYDFKTGSKGTGYYPSPKPVSMPPSKFALTHKLSEHQEPSNRNFESKTDLKKHRDALRKAAAQHLNDLV